MQTISERQRLILQTLRLCEVDDPALPIIQGIPNHGTRVLIPTELFDFFEPILYFEGSIGAFPIRLAVEEFARTKIGTPYRRRATPAQSPKVFSCSTFVKAAFAFVGVYMPRFAIDQSYCGQRIQESKQAALAFSYGRFPIIDPERSVGHVSILTGQKTRIHAATEERGVCEDPLEETPHTQFIDILPEAPYSLVILPTKIQGLETALDLARWLQRPPRHL